ncbi:MAG: hypothetical protein R6W80_07940 [Haliea sp.]
MEEVERVMDAMRTVPRAAFVPEHMKRFAFDNGPLPIGHNQTISQPYIVALMTDLLDPQPADVILEIGTGNGYQGWLEHAPYDGIIVTAAATHIPPMHIEQLKPGGHMVIPVVMPYFHRELMLVEKEAKDKTKISNILGVAFVPMVDKLEVSMGADGSAAEST